MAGYTDAGVLRGAYQWIVQPFVGRFEIGLAHRLACQPLLMSTLAAAQVRVGPTNLEIFNTTDKSGVENGSNDRQTKERIRENDGVGDAELSALSTRRLRESVEKKSRITK